MDTEQRPIGRTPSRLERIIGGSVPGVLVRLALASLLVGVVMSVLGIRPGDIVIWIEERLVWLTNLSFETLETVFGYFLLGAAVVVPVWILWRVFRVARM